MSLNVLYVFRNACRGVMWKNRFAGLTSPDEL